MENTRLTEDQVLEILIRSNDQHEPNYKIAKEMGLSQHTIGKVVGRKQKVHKARGKMTEKEIERMKELRAQGLSNSKIAKELNIAVVSVRRYLGKQPAGIRSEYGSIVAHVTGESFVKEKEMKEMKEKKAKLKIVKTDISFAGVKADYKVSSDGRVRIIFPTGTAFDFAKNDFYEFMLELCEIGDWLTQNAADNIRPCEKRMDGTYSKACQSQ